MLKRQFYDILIFIKWVIGQNVWNNIGIWLKYKK